VLGITNSTWRAKQHAATHMAFYGRAAHATGQPNQVPSDPGGLDDPRMTRHRHPRGP